MGVFKLDFSTNPLTGQALAPMSESDFQYFCDTIKSLAGISLKAAKKEMAQTRLRYNLIELGLTDFSSYREYLEKLPASDPEWQRFINNLTTNKTDFFREPKHFEYMVQTVLPEWLKTSEKTFRVWSAASSTGEEPYTLAMILNKHLPKGRDFHIYATDIDTEVLQKATNGVYSMEKHHEIPEDYHKAITLGTGTAQGWFRIHGSLREKVTFAQHNLTDTDIPKAGPFDLVLCRNVFIYFTKETVTEIAKKIHKTVKPEGYFMIGHSENLSGVQEEWTFMRSSTFKKISKK